MNPVKNKVNFSKTVSLTKQNMNMISCVVVEIAFHMSKISKRFIGFVHIFGTKQEDENITIYFSCFSLKDLTIKMTGFKKNHFVSIN